MPPKKRTKRTNIPSFDPHRDTSFVPGSQVSQPIDTLPTRDAAQKSQSFFYHIGDAVCRFFSKKYVPFLVGSGLLLASLSVTAYFVNVSDSSTTLFSQPEGSDIVSSPTPLPTPTPEPGMTITLMGRGGAGHDGGALTDTILVARILETQKRVVLVSIPRDLWVQIPYDGKDGMKSKINAAYAIGVDSKNYSNKIERYTGSTGGGNLASDVLKTVTNLSSDHYITIDFSGFEQAIDSIGGIDITVDTAFTDYEYPIAGRENLDCSTYAPVALDSNANVYSEADLIAAGKLDATLLTGLPKDYPCRYEMLAFSSGKQQMNGKTALKYVRSRHSSQEASDFSRSRRQQKLITAVIEKMFSINAIGKVPTFFSTLRSHIDTDLSATDVLGLLPKASEYRSYPITSLTLTSDNYLLQGYTADRQFALFPLTGEENFDAIKDWIGTAIDPQKALRYPTIEIIGNRSTASQAATLQTTLNTDGFPTHLGQLLTKEATTGATLILKSTNIDPKVLEEIKKTAGVLYESAQKSLPGIPVSTRDIQIVLPAKTVTKE